MRQNILNQFEKILDQFYNPLKTSYELLAYNIFIEYDEFDDKLEEEKKNFNWIFEVPKWPEFKLKHKEETQ